MPVTWQGVLKDRKVLGVGLTRKELRKVLYGTPLCIELESGYYLLLHAGQDEVHIAKDITSSGLLLSKADLAIKRHENWPLRDPKVS